MNKTDLALFAGLIASDGHLDKDYHGIRFITSNKDFLEKVSIMSKKYKTKIWKSKSGFEKNRYVLYIYNKKLKNKLKNIYCIPRGKKSETIDLPNIKFNEKLDFIKGLFSRDGSISFDTKNNKKYPQIIFWSKSNNLVINLKNFLEDLGIKCGLNFTESKDQYRLTIRERNSLIIFKKKIGFIHPEKQRRLDSLNL